MSPGLRLVPWDSLGPPGLAEFVDEILGQPGSLVSRWEWLISEQAENALALGEVFGRRDVGGSIATALEGLRSDRGDYQLLAGYLREQTALHPSGWLDDWLDRQAERNGAPALLILEVTCLAGEPTTRSARRVLDLLRNGSLPRPTFKRVMFGAWGFRLPGPAFQELIRTFSEYPELRGTALFLVSARLQQRGLDEISELEEIAVPLVTDPALLPADQFGAWEQVARHLVVGHARGIARTILGAHRDGPGVSHLPAAGAEEILGACIASDPEGVWIEFSDSLQPAAAPRGLFTNFPKGLVDRFPRDRVLSWLGDSLERAMVLVPLVAPTFDDDDSLAAILADRYGDRQDLSRGLLWNLCGELSSQLRSQHWADHATRLEGVARTTGREGLRRWATRAAEDCREQAAIYRVEEEEERLGE